MLVGTSVRSKRNRVEASVLVDDMEQPLYRRPSDGKIFVVGTPGRPYTLLVRNLELLRRIEVINTVDGRHTLKDEPGDLVHNRGFAIGASSSSSFRGWRQSDRQIRDFVFGEPQRSITAQATGSAANVGVIGFAVYCERQSFVKPQSYGSYLGGLESLRSPFERERRASTLGGSGHESLGGSLGTGMGELRDDPVGRTHFDRDGNEPDILIIGYESEEVLTTWGVIAPADPNPFPGMETGYAAYNTTYGG